LELRTGIANGGIFGLILVFLLVSCRLCGEKVLL
jgi:hypothetical protein